jgi:hypothetical protein
MCSVPAEIGPGLQSSAHHSLLCVLCAVVLQLCDSGLPDPDMCLIPEVGKPPDSSL